MGKELLKRIACVINNFTMVYGELLLKIDSAVRHLGGLVVHLRSSSCPRSFRFLIGSETMLRAETASCGLATAKNGELLLKIDSAVRHLGGLVVHLRSSSCPRSFRFLIGSETMLRAETASCDLATAKNGELLLKIDSAVRHLGGLVVHLFTQLVLSKKFSIFNRLRNHAAC